MTKCEIYAGQASENRKSLEYTKKYCCSRIIHHDYTITRSDNCSGSDRIHNFSVNMWKVFFLNKSLGS